jgi:DNA helicase-2/ATP-dependent DNA helicase PcrA
MSELLSALNSEQQKAAQEVEGPVLVLSGPGSGKTRVITHRIAFLTKEKKVSPERILAVTFTNKAANEMKERLGSLLGKETPRPPWIGTFHSICARVLRRDGPQIGLSPNFLIYDSSDSLSLIKDVMKDLNINPKNFSPGAILGTIGSAKNELLGPTEYQRLARGIFQETAAQVYERYQKELRENQALDFDDLLLETIHLLQERKEVLEKYQTQFEYVLIDEYQDTNHAQYIFAQLVSGGHQNLFVVGDASQAIYGWRGADFRNILNFEKDFPKAKIFNLEQNYRSTKTILNTAQAVISQNKTHPILKLWTTNDDGVPVIVYEAKNETDEADFILRMIEKLSNTSKYSLKDFAVLYRTNAQSRVLEEKFLEASVPYTLIGGTRFYDRREIKDILAYLRLVVNKADSVSYKRVVNVPPRGIGPAALGNPNNEKIAKFNDLLAELRVKAETLNSMETIDLVLASTQFLKFLDDGTPEGLSRIENVKELRSVASEFPKLTDFLENVALVESEYRSTKDGKSEAATLMTLHSAKGLEFPIVFMVGMEEGLFPHSRALMDLSELEEERRLAYVGITRAKDQLFLTYTRERLYFGTRTPGIVSRFVTDIPEDLLIPLHL